MRRVVGPCWGKGGGGPILAVTGGYDLFRFFEWAMFGLAIVFDGDLIRS